jgi:hypothetical protein
MRRRPHLSLSVGNECGEIHRMEDGEEDMVPIQKLTPPWRRERRWGIKPEKLQ